MILLARVVRTVVAAVVLLIVAGIVLHLLHASGPTASSRPSTSRAWLVSPFANVFHPKNADVALAVNWGLAALVYAIVGGLIAGLLARAGGASRGAWMRRRRGVTTAEP